VAITVFGAWDFLAVSSVVETNETATLAADAFAVAVAVVRAALAGTVRRTREALVTIALALEAALPMS
jgi:hypothetical protein